jgi:tetratricopeptide (TPR) repeat protein
MPYVRRKGNQLAIVHGVRDSETRRVEQKTLFCLYSKGEALAAIGDERHHFRQMLEQDNHGLRFEWPKIEAAIRDDLEHLPDLYTYKKERVEERFRTGLLAFAKELIATDPQTLISSARVVQTNRRELAYLRDLIEWRLQLCDQTDNEWNRDNPFYWRTASARREVPPEEWEKLSTLYERGEHEDAEALARLLTDCWPNFARGFNYLGLIAMQRDELDTAVAHFDEAARVGRTLFPKRMAKARYWSDHDTRPYIRALIYKAQALNRKGAYAEALVLCERLEKECGQDIAAALERAPIYLNSGLWLLAIASAKHVHRLFPVQNFPLAFGYFEAGDLDEALAHFLAAAITFPRAARILTGVRRTAEVSTAEEAQDHNEGVEMVRDLGAYLTGAGGKARRFFKSIVTSADVLALIEEAQEAGRRWREESDEDRKWFRRMNEMQSLDFARRHARGLRTTGDVTPVRGRRTRSRPERVDR